MVDYAIPAARAAAIREGQHPFLLQSPRGRLARHAQVGEAMRLRVGRQNTETPIDAVCVVRATLHIAANGVRRVLNEKGVGAGVGSDEAAAILARCTNAEQGMPDAGAAREKLAVDLGFVDWAALFADTLRTAKGKGELKGGVFVRELVGWRLANG